MNKNIFDEKGRLSVVVGEGYLSAYEVSVLKPGDTVVTASLAAEGFSAFFNGAFLFTSEVVIIDDHFGVRVTGLLPPRGGAEVPGHSDQAIEMLPFSVRLAEISISLSELEGVGPGTIISLDAAYSEEEDAELLVAGIPAAKGKVEAAEENMSLRITEVYGEAAIPAGLEVRSSGNLLERAPRRERSKDYDFKRPDKFSRRAIERMREIHDLFVRNLRLKYGLFEDYELLSDQLAFGEFLQMAEGESCRWLLLQNRPWPRQIRGEPEPGMMLPGVPSTSYVEPENARYPATEAHKQFIAGIVRGAGREMQNGVFLCVSKKETVRRLAEDGEKRDFLLAALRGAWKSIAGMNFRLARETDSMDEIRVIHENEMIMLFAVKGRNDRTLMYVIYPYLTLQHYMRILD